MVWSETYHRLTPDQRVIFSELTDVLYDAMPGSFKRKHPRAFWTKTALITIYNDSLRCPGEAVEWYERALNNVKMG